MSHPNVHLTIDDGIARIVLDRAGRKNACTRMMFEYLVEAASEITSAKARAVIITGANDDFCSGADMSGEGDERDDREDHQLVTMRGIGEGVIALHDLPMPVIAAVDGVAVGAGLGMALAGDLLYCTDRARFSLIFAKRGLSLDFGTSYLLPRRVGLHHAKRMAFTGEIVGAAAAAEMGFVNGVVAPEELADTVDELAATIAAGPPLALSMSKRLLDNAAHSSLAQAVEAEALAQNVNFGTTDTIEAMRAFSERRTPTFGGR
jgi:2-(1,2-epoxy-1,2-dihydrophenyl)acetyl-CoA isomerase